MESNYFMPSSCCSLHPTIHALSKANSPLALLNIPPNRFNPIGFRTSKNYFTCLCYHHQKKPKSLFKKESFGIKTKKWSYHQLVKNPSEEDDRKKKGSLGGAIALVIGTSIGTGLLALPQKASPAGFVPSSVSVIVCWAFLLIDALLLVEINVALLRKRKRRKRDGELEVISFRTMAQETLGEWGATLVSITYVLLQYSCMAAYCSKSGDLLFQWTNLPAPVSGCLFTALFTMLISIGGTRATDLVNQWMTASMIGLLLAIEVLAVAFGGWSGVGEISDWAKIPAAMPVIIFSLVYHDITPVICAYLEGDLDRIRASVIFGSLVPLMALLVWNAIVLGLAAEVEQIVDPIELLFRVEWSGVSVLVGAFSILAVGTSLLTTMLGFSAFFKEQLKNLVWLSPPTQELNGGWWGRNKVNIMAMTIVVAPSLLVTTTSPDAFSAATDIAGGYFMTVMYGVLPPAMAWTMKKKEYESSGEKSLSDAWPALIMVALFSCGIMVDQILQDTHALQL